MKLIPSISQIIIIIHNFLFVFSVNAHFVKKRSNLHIKKKLILFANNGDFKSFALVTERYGIYQ